MRRKNMRRLFFLALLFAATYGFAGERGKNPTLADIRHASDEEVVSLMAYQSINRFLGNSQEASLATTEAFIRGPRMVPKLLRLRGDVRTYWGGGLALPISSESYVGKVTVEVAALYVICAIYEGRMPFAMAPALLDLRISDPKRRTRSSSPFLVKRAWDSVESWSVRLERDGIAKLRDRKDSPLREAQVTF